MEEKYDFNHIIKMLHEPGSFNEKLNNQKDIQSFLVQSKQTQNKFVKNSVWRTPVVSEGNKKANKELDDVNQHSPTVPVLEKVKLNQNNRKISNIKWRPGLNK